MSLQDDHVNSLFYILMKIELNVFFFKYVYGQRTFRLILNKVLLMSWSEISIKISWTEIPVRYIHRILEGYTWDI